MGTDDVRPAVFCSRGLDLFSLFCIKKRVNFEGNLGLRLWQARFLEDERMLKVMQFLLKSNLGGGFNQSFCSPRSLGKIPILTSTIFFLPAMLILEC